MEPRTKIPALACGENGAPSTHSRSSRDVELRGSGIIRSCAAWKEKEAGPPVLLDRPYPKTLQVGLNGSIRVLPFGVGYDALTCPDA
jgi:hypothetical protein